MVRLGRLKPERVSNDHSIANSQAISKPLRLSDKTICIVAGSVHVIVFRSADAQHRYRAEQHNREGHLPPQNKPAEIHSSTSFRIAKECPPESTLPTQAGRRITTGHFQ